jgi:serine/threonine protein kinase
MIIFLLAWFLVIVLLVLLHPPATAAARVRILTVQAPNAADELAGPHLGALVGLHAAGAWGDVDVVAFNSTPALIAHHTALTPAQQRSVALVLFPFVHTPAAQSAAMVAELNELIRMHPRLPIVCAPLPDQRPLVGVEQVVLLRNRANDDFAVIIQHMHRSGVTRFSLALPDFWNGADTLRDLACRAGLFVHETVRMPTDVEAGCGDACRHIDELDVASIDAIVVGGTQAALVAVAARLQSRNRNLRIYLRPISGGAGLATQLRNSGIVGATVFLPVFMDIQEDPILLRQYMSSLAAVRAMRPDLATVESSSSSTEAFVCGHLAGQLLRAVANRGDELALTSPGEAVLDELYVRRRTIALSPSLVLGPFTRAADCAGASAAAAALSGECPCNTGLRFNSLYSLDFKSLNWTLEMRATFPLKCTLPPTAGTRLTVSLLARDSTCARDTVAAYRAVFADYNANRPLKAPEVSISTPLFASDESAVILASASSATVLVSSGVVVPVVDPRIVSDQLRKSRAPNATGDDAPPPAVYPLPIFFPNTPLVLPSLEYIFPFNAPPATRCTAVLLYWAQRSYEALRTSKGAVLVLYDNPVLSTTCAKEAALFNFTFTAVDVRRERAEVLPATGEAVCKLPHVVRALRNAASKNGTEHLHVLLRVETLAMVTVCVQEVWAITGSATPIVMQCGKRLLGAARMLEAANVTIASPWTLVAELANVPDADSAGGDQSVCYSDARLGAKALCSVLARDEALHDIAAEHRERRQASRQCSGRDAYAEVSAVRKALVDAIYRSRYVVAGRESFGPFVRCDANATDCSPCTNGQRGVFLNYVDHSETNMVPPIIPLAPSTYGVQPSFRSETCDLSDVQIRNLALSVTPSSVVVAATTTTTATTAAATTKEPDKKPTRPGGGEWRSEPPPASASDGLDDVVLHTAIVTPLVLITLCSAAIACAALSRLQRASNARAAPAAYMPSLEKRKSDTSEEPAASDVAQAARRPSGSFTGTLFGGAPLMLQALDQDEDGSLDEQQEQQQQQQQQQQGQLVRGMCALPSSFPINPSKRALRFDANTLDVGEIYEETIELTNRSQETVVWRVQLPASSYRFMIRANTIGGVLLAGQSVDLKISFKFKCTTTVNETLAIQVEHHGYFMVLLRHRAAMSILLDPEEIRLVHSERPIGDGAQATVYRGHWRERTVAVKFFKDQHQALKDFHKFEHEMVLLQRLQHPCITQLIGAVVEPGKLCLVMEYLRYGSLRNVLRSRAPSVLLRTVIARDAACGLAFLHSQGVLHRDVKPENVLVASLSPKANPVAKLVDFGAARLVDRKANELDLTRAVGTPIYMAPEVLKHEPYSAEADVFSFGMTLYEMFAPDPPYHMFVHAWEVAQFVTAGRRLTIPRGAPVAFQQLIEACWANDAWKRPSLRSALSKLGTLIKTLDDGSHTSETTTEDDTYSAATADDTTTSFPSRLPTLNGLASMDDSARSPPTGFGAGAGFVSARNTAVRTIFAGSRSLSNSRELAIIRPARSKVVDGLSYAADMRPRGEDKSERSAKSDDDDDDDDVGDDADDDEADDADDVVDDDEDNEDEEDEEDEEEELVSTGTDEYVEDESSGVGQVASLSESV